MVIRQRHFALQRASLDKRYMNNNNKYRRLWSSQ